MGFSGCPLGASTLLKRVFYAPDYALMVGVPARRKGWMSRHGHVLESPDAGGVYTCPESGFRYKEVEPGILRCLDLDEEAPLPQDLSVGKVFYRELKKKP